MSHVAANGWGVCVHCAVSLLHASMVQELPSSQRFLPGEQTPCLQRSPSVHGFPSEHVPLVFEYLHPITLSHVSEVHAFLSSQDRMLPRHEPDASQTSLLVQALPSSQPNDTEGLKTQAPTLLQLSCVQGLLSLHDSLPGLQDFCEQISPTVQALPSSHEMLSADE